MRYLVYLCFLSLLFCCRLSVRANVSHTPTPTLRHKAHLHIPQSTVAPFHQSVTTPYKTDNRDGAGTFREHFPIHIATAFCKIYASRLLPDVHAIIRSLIFPQHIFW
jgi:hypothetical protein